MERTSDLSAKRWYVVMFSERELKKRGASSRIIERIGRKQRGGSSGSAGFRQEDFFAVYKMIGAARRHLEHGDLFWMIQNASALVDDLMTGNGSYEFFQVKTSSRVTWTSLEFDFREQANLCTLFELPKYKLFLVVSSSTQRDLLRRQRPRSLKKTFVLSFPRMERTTDLLRLHKPVFKDLESLCAGRASSADLESIAAIAFTTVLDRPSRSRRYSVVQFLNALRKHPSIPVRAPFADASSLWDRASLVLRGIRGLKVSIEDGFFVFDYHRGLETGRVVKCGTAEYRRLLRRIVDSSPKNFDEFERLL